MAGNENIPKTGTWLFAEKLIKKYKSLPLKQRSTLSVAGWKATLAYSLDKKVWSELMTNDILAYKKNRSKQKLTTEEKEKIPAKGFAALKKASTEYKRSIKLDLAKKTLKSLSIYGRYLIFRFYAEVAFRNGLATVQIGEGLNKLIKKKGVYTIFMKQHKTSDKMGEITVVLSKALSKVLATYIKYRNQYDLKHSYLLVNQKGEPLSKKSLGVILAQLTRRYFGKSFGTRLIRIMKVQSESGTLEKAKKLANDMLHSMAQSQQYNKK
jgi:hypothetical protein